MHRMITALLISLTPLRIMKTTLVDEHDRVLEACDVDEGVGK